MKKKVSIMFLTLIGLGTVSQAQDTIRLNLNNAIDLARQQSVDAQRISNSYNSSYWTYKAYKASLMPRIDLTGTLPDFNRSISSQSLPDGTQDFISYNTWNSSLDLGIVQPITATGGEVYVNTSLQRIDNVDQEDGLSYYSNPIAIGFRQELFGFNNFRWQKMTEPMKMEEARRDQVESREDLSTQVVRSYFSYLLAQDNLRTMEKNLVNNQELYKIAQGRYRLGKIAENDLLQMELSVLESQTGVESSRIQMQRTKNELYSLLNITSSVPIELEIPIDIRDIDVDPDQAVAEANKNRKDVISFERRRVEADMNLARAKADRRLSVTVFGSFGLNKTASVIQEAYQQPLLDQERFNVGVSVPIFDGGQGRANYRIAESEKELVYADVAENTISFEREVRLKASEMKVLKGRLEIAAKSDTIASRRYEITRQRYKQGKIDITELNLSLDSKDQSRRSYIQSLRDYWEAYFVLRRMTLYDFERAQPLYQRDRE